MTPPPTVLTGVAGARMHPAQLPVPEHSSCHSDSAHQGVLRAAGQHVRKLTKPARAPDGDVRTWPPACRGGASLLLPPRARPSGGQTSSRGDGWKVKAGPLPVGHGARRPVAGVPGRHHRRAARLRTDSSHFISPTRSPRGRLMDVTPDVTLVDAKGRRAPELRGSLEGT